MKKILLYAIPFVCFLGKAQNIENLYLISGHPYDNTDEEFASYLWHYAESSLDTVSILSSKDDFLENVKVYPEQKLVVVHKTNSIRRKGDNHRLMFIDYKDSLQLSEIPVNTEGLIEYYLSLTEGKLLLDIFTDKRDSYFNKIDLKSLKIEEGDMTDFVHAQLTGIPGGMIYGKDYLLVYSNEKNGSLAIPLVGDRDKRPKYPYILPQQYHFHSYTRHVVPVNNTQVFVVVGKKEVKKSAIGSRQILFFNKKEKRWHDITIPGSIAKMRGFGKWVCGYVFNDSIKGKKLPGAEKWTHRESGLSPKERWGYYPEFGKDDFAYAPGILYFYNAYTKAYFELETNQADSEVVLVQDGTVIYRAYDELYRVEIINGKTPGKPTLLLKDDRVPDIHWAFF